MLTVQNFLQSLHAACRYPSSLRTQRQRRHVDVKCGISRAVEAAEVRCLLSASTLDSFPANPGGSGGTGGVTGKMNPLTSIPKLNSLAGAAVTIYLDFDGHSESQDWPSQRTDGGTGPILTPVFDIDNDLTTFSDEELRMIEELWYRVAEDYMPFRVNVTTVDPGVYNDFEAVLVSIGGAGTWFPGVGGVAFINSFSGVRSNTSYVFSDNTGRGGIDHMKGTALAASHEVGHMLGLDHHAVYDANGNQTAGYDPGTPTLGPIMGAPYGSLRETWNNGPDTRSATSFQLDLDEMTRPANQTFQFRSDDHFAEFATATALNVVSPTVTAKGIIGQNNDADTFRFETNTGDISFSVDGLTLALVQSVPGLNPGTNLDAVLRLFDESGNLIVQSDPGNSLSATLAASVTVGTYYVSVSGTGEYGNLGQYTLTGTVIPLPSTPTMIGPVGTLTQPIPLFEWTIGANAASYDLEVDNLTTGQAGYYTRNVTATSHLADRQFVQGDFQARVRTVAADATFSAWSNYVLFTIDIPQPVPPVISRPQGDIGDSFPLFEWNSSANASTYTLWVSSITTGQRIIFRTGQSTTTYTHFNPLPDGSYRAWVRAFNAVGEYSAWSTPVQFTIDVPIPAAPTITAPAAVTTSINPRIVWTAVDGAASYDLWVNNLSTGRSQYIRQTNIARTPTYFDPPVLTQGNYTAWVRAANGNGEYSPWSTGYLFTVDILPPATPRMTGPLGLNGSTTVTTIKPTFTWTAAARASVYDLWVNNMTTGQGQIVRKSDITTTSYTSIANLPQGEYRAFIRGINSAGEVGEWSNVFIFTIDEATPSVPKITAPVPNPAGSVENANPTFTWTSDVRAPLYELKIDDLTLNTVNVIRVTGITTESYTIPTAKRLAEHTYVAQVRAYNNSGDTSAWSELYRFRIDVPEPSTPTPLGPDGTSRDTTPEFTWTHASNSVRYEILVRDLVRGENIVLNVTTFGLRSDGTTAFYVLPNAKALRPSTYRFWIRAFNSLGQSSSWSSSKTFVISAKLDPSLLQDVDIFAIVDEVILASAVMPDDSQQTDGDSSESANPSSDARLQVPANGRWDSITPPPREARVAANATEGDDAALIDATMWMLADPSVGAESRTVTKTTTRS